MLRPFAHLPAIALALSLTFCVLDPAVSQEGAPVLRPGLIGEYFDLKADATPHQDVPPKTPLSVVRLERQINIATTQGAFPGTRLSDQFMVRWSGILRIPKAGEYTLWVTSDDGSRFFLNNERVIDNWGLHGMSRRDVKRNLGPGDYQIRILYYENSSDAGCIFGWDPPAEVGKSGPVPAANLFHDANHLKLAQNRMAFSKLPPTTPNGWIDQEGEPRRSGVIILEGDKVAVGEPSGVKTLYEPEAIKQVEFAAPVKPAVPPASNPPPLQWRHGVVGQLTSGASANPNNDRVRLFTSSRNPAQPVPSFSMVYVPAPPIGQITARVTRIERNSEDALAGVILRDGTGLDSRSMMLAIRPTGGATMRHWKSRSASERVDPRSTIRPHHWIRIIFDGKHVLGLTSHDGTNWRPIWKLPERFESKTRLFGLVASSEPAPPPPKPADPSTPVKPPPPSRPWAADFDSVKVVALEGEGTDVISQFEPRLHLVDGSVIRGPVTSSDNGKIIQIGHPWNQKTLALYARRIDFLNPMPPDREPRLSTVRPGVLLPSNDFLEASFARLAPDFLTVDSPLFGTRELIPGSGVDSVVISELPRIPRRAALKVETWDGQILFARRFSVAGGKFIFDTPSLGRLPVMPDRIRRIAPSPPVAP